MQQADDFSKRRQVKVITPAHGLSEYGKMTFADYS
jgi:hypothetical protein